MKADAFMAAELKEVYVIMKGVKFMTIVLAVALLACLAGTAFAAYTLNPEVKDATPALIKASQIGVRVNENKAMASLPDKDAILVMSFGTTFKDSREKTIDKTVADIRAAHPGVKVVLAFTSHIIVDRIKAKEGLTIPTPEEALAQLKKDGYTRIALTTLDIFPGMEYDYDAAVYDLYKGSVQEDDAWHPHYVLDGTGGTGGRCGGICKSFLHSVPQT